MPLACYVHDPGFDANENDDSSNDVDRDSLHRDSERELIIACTRATACPTGAPGVGVVLRDGSMLLAAWRAFRGAASSYTGTSGCNSTKLRHARSPRLQATPAH
jgi:hypothetical protein